jgi:exonuclease SbcC
VILRAVGVERIERMAKTSRERASTARDRLDALVTRIADARGTTLPELDALAALEQAIGAQTGADERLKVAQQALADAQALDRDIEQRREKANEQRRARTKLTESLEGWRATAADIGTRIINNRKVLDEADAVRAAVADVERLTAVIATEQAAVQTQQAEASSKAARARELDGELRDVDVQIERSEMVFADRKKIEDAEQAIPGLETAVSEAAGAVGVAEDALEDLRGKHVAGADERIKGLRGGLQEVLDAESDYVYLVATSTLQADDQAVALAAELPEQVAQAQAAVKNARDRKDEADKKLAAARTTAARRSAITAATQNHDAAAARRAGIEKARETAAAAEVVARDAASDHRVKLGDAREALVEVSTLAQKAGPLEGAKGRLAELEPSLVSARARVAEFEAELSAAPVPEDVPAGPALSPLDRAVRDADIAAKAAHAAAVKAETALELSRQVSDRVAALEAERGTAEGELADWTRLAIDFGRDGIQSAEVDSAGPELTELTNDLLRCFGSRYTVSIETQRLSADGKSMIEECRVQVIDTEQGHEGEAREFSGGQKVILSEAVSLALTMLACRRAGVERPTIVRDESGAALDAVNARAWIAMLRRAVELVGADRILFVSHSREVQEMADARIEVG